MQYQTARAEIQSRPPEVSWTSVAFETLVMVAIAGALVFFI